MTYRTSAASSLAIVLALGALLPGCNIEVGDPDPEPDPVGACPADEEGSLPPVALACDAFSEALTLSDDPERVVDYVVDCQANVTAPLTIEAGTVIAFETEAGLAIGDGGSIDAQGDDCEPVVFEGVTHRRGAWKGLFIDSAEDNLLSKVDIRDAGGAAFNSNGDLGSVVLYADARLTMRDSHLREGAAHGLNGSYGGATLIWERNVVDSHDAEPLRIHASLADALDGASSFAGNARDAVLLVRGELEAPAVWASLDVPYQVDRDVLIDSQASLELEAGARIAFDTDAGLMATSGRLTIAGTADAPVELYGVNQEPGRWRGVFIESGEPNRISHAVIRHAGGNSFNSNGDLGAIVVYADAELTLEDTSVADSGADGLNANYGDATLAFEGTNRFTGNVGRPIFLGAYDAAAVTAATVVEGNPGGDFVYVWVSDLESGITEWESLSVPYRVTTQNDIFREINVRDQATLRLLPGVSMVFEGGTGIEADGGSLDFQGTAADPIEMVGSQATPGHWKGLFANGSSTVATYQLSHVRIGHAGSGAFNSNGDEGAIVVWADTTLTADNLTIFDNAAACDIIADYNGDVLQVTNSPGLNICDGP